MDQEPQYKELKNRKGSSCSTIQSPFQQLNPQFNQAKRIPKLKKLKKITKLKKHSSLNQSNREQSSQKSSKEFVKQNKIRIFRLIKDITKIFNFHKDTYLVCLKVANLIKFEGQQAQCIQVAATIAFMVQKLYESYKISFTNMERWSKFTLTKGIYSQTEAVILQGLKYEIPIIDPEWDEQNIENQINKIQSSYQI